MIIVSTSRIFLQENILLIRTNQLINMDIQKLNLTLLLMSVFLSSFCVSQFVYESLGAHARTALAKRLVWLQQQLQSLFINTISGKTLLKVNLVACLLAASLGYYLANSVVFAILSMVLVWKLPEFAFGYLTERRRQLFEENFPATLDKMVSAGKASMSFIQLFEVVATQDTPPASQEFGLAVQDYRLGKDFTTVLEEMKLRINSSLFSLFATAAAVNRDKGGNLPMALATMSKSFKEIRRLDEKILTASAEGRKGARVISLMPIAIFIFVSTVQPGLITILTDSFFGWVIITIAGLFYLIGFLWLRKVLRIDV